MTATLDARLLAAHKAGDRAALATLYREAGDRAADDREARFYLTHAYVFALDAGVPEAETIRRRLVDLKSEPA